MNGGTNEGLSASKQGGILYQWLTSKVFLFLGILVLIFFGLILGFFLREDKVAVLTYHDILDGEVDINSVNISVSKFEKQIKWLHNHNYKSLSMNDLYEWKRGKKKIPRKSVLITFDDGWNSFYTKAMPILEKYNMKASVFVIFKYALNCTNNNDDTYMNFSQIKDVLDNHPDMMILSHSYDLHNKMAADSKDYYLYNDDFKIVKNISNTNIEYYAYPYGHTNSQYIRALKDNGYKMAFTFGPYDFVSKNDNNYKIPRLGIFEATKDWKFKLKLFLEM